MRLHYAELDDHEVEDGITTVPVTLRHCLRRLPFDEALAIADSALREGVDRSTLIRIAEEASAPGSAQMRRVAALASADAANPCSSLTSSMTCWSRCWPSERMNDQGGRIVGAA